MAVPESWQFQDPAGSRGFPWLPFRLAPAQPNCYTFYLPLLAASLAAPVRHVHRMRQACARLFFPLTLSPQVQLPPGWLHVVILIAVIYIYIYPYISRYIPV